MSAVRVAVVGGGPAGMAAAIFAAESGARVILIERNEKLGKKLYITGKGRCNLTNTATTERAQENIPRGAIFLRSALAAFGSRDLREWIESLGVPTVEERGGRIFPASGKASDVTRALECRLRAGGVDILLNARVHSVNAEDGRVSNVALSDGRTLECDAAVIATGGMSYPSTGSTGDGYRFAESFGHTIITPRPALTAVESDAEWVRSLQGLTLKNVVMRADCDGRRVMAEMGEMLFTHFGVSGPLALTLSSRIPDAPRTLERLAVSIDLKPGLNIEQVDARLVRELTENSRKRLDTILRALLPERLAMLFPKLCGIPLDRTGSNVTRAERVVLAGALKSLHVPVDRLRGFGEAVVTRGGVDTRQIDPRTMESRLVRGLFFAGEVIDVDALTGGFNLTIAFSTGVKAGSAGASAPSYPVG